MDLDHPHLPGFLSAQLRDHGGQAELDAGLWTLFAVPAADPDANALAQSLLRTAPFAHDSGQTEDDQWTLYYVDTANRPLALAWLDDTIKLVAGEIRPVAPAHHALVTELITSAKPHRLARISPPATPAANSPPASSTHPPRSARCSTASTNASRSSSPASSPSSSTT
jgi:hypothetical protein